MPSEDFNNWSDQDIAYAYEQGTSMKVIASKLGIAPESVRKILLRMNVEIRSHPSSARRRLSLPHEVIVARYHDGASTTELGKAYGVSPETIRRLLLKHGTSPRPAHQAISTTANYRQPMSAEQRAMAVELYEQGLSAAQVAKRMGFASKRTILNVVNNAGVTRPGTRGVAEADLKSPAMQEIAERHQAGEAVQSLAKEYGIPRSTLQRRLRALDARP